MEALRNLSLSQKLIALSLFLIFFPIHIFNFLKEWFDFIELLSYLAVAYLGLGALHASLQRRGNRLAEYLVPIIILMFSFILSGLIFQLWVLAP